MGLKEWVLPQERKFFDLLEGVAENVVKGAEALVDMFQDFRNVAEKRRRVKEIEHAGDNIVHEIFEALNKTFITPIDREDIQSLASNLDNILDMIDAAANRAHLYEIDAPSDAMRQLAQVILDGARQLQAAVTMIRDMKQGDKVEEIAVEVHRLENVADDVMNSAVARLFHDGKDPIHIIKFKEIIERLEEATDYCEDVANVLSDVVAKNR
ncbi:MAG TPA: DUF47 family protein [Thermoplasmata archaeon]